MMAACAPALEPVQLLESKFRRILGINFFLGDAAEAIGRLDHGGLIVVPAAPALKNMPHDREYREALLGADLALTDSSFMVLIWNLLHHESIRRVSGLKYLRELLRQPEVRLPHNTFWIMANPESAATNVRWLRGQGIDVGTDDFYIAPSYGGSTEDPELLAMLGSRQPRNIIVTLGGGTQERLGLYLKRHLDYRPAIHCTGAAIAFLSGDQVRIPDWADRSCLGWLFRCISSPKLYGKRYWEARKLASLMVHYRERLPVRALPVDAD